LAAVPAAKIGRDHDPLADFQADHVRTNFNQIPDNLVTGNPDRTFRVFTMLTMQNAEIGSTNPRTDHFQEGFVGSDAGLFPCIQA
jgi:hypothetical protein